MVPIKHIFSLLALFFTISSLSAQIFSDEKKNELIESIKPESPFNNNPFEVKKIDPEIEFKKKIYLRELNSYLEEKQKPFDLNDLKNAFKVEFKDPLSIKTYIPILTMDLKFTGGYYVNRYNDPYFRWDGFTGNIWERQSYFGGITIGGLNLHDPISWFTRKEKKRRAETVRRITQWVYCDSAH